VSGEGKRRAKANGNQHAGNQTLHIELVLAIAAPLIRVIQEGKRIVQPEAGFKSPQEKFGANRSSSTSKLKVEVRDVS